jgi:uncharacterized protein YkwD
VWSAYIVYRRYILAAMIAQTLLAACDASRNTAPPAPLPTAAVIPRPSSSNIVVPARPTPTPYPRVAAVAPTSHAPTPAAARSPSASATTPATDSISATPPIDPAGQEAAAREALLVVAINQVRTANGLPPYHHSPELSSTAHAHSCDMASHSMISHTSFDGRTLSQRLAGSNPAWEWPSENIAAGIDDPAGIVALWMDEPPDGWHRRNILDQDQREVGAGYCYAAEDSTGNHHYWTADFARRAGS